MYTYKAFLCVYLKHFSYLCIMDNKDLIRMGKRLSFLLRHDKDAFEKGLIDQHGWRNISELITLGYSQPIFDELVDTNNKKRYEYSTDGVAIRARQGHSIPVDVELKEMTPPDILYHGTATKFLESIHRNGLRPGTRLYVHLSTDEATAVKVGTRHGKPYVIKINCKQMVAEGCRFYLSNNGVWLTDKVMPKHFIQESSIEE